MDAILENNNAFQNLLARIAAGDTAAYDLLFRKYYASMVLYTDNKVRIWFQICFVRCIISGQN